MRKDLLKIFCTSVLVIVMGITMAQAIPPIPPPPASVTLEAIPLNNVPADGVSYYSLVATVRDAYGSPSPEANVYFNTNFGDLSTKYGFFSGKGWINITDDEGKTQAIITSNQVGNAEISAAVSSLTPATVNVVFISPDIIFPIVTNPEANPGEILLEEPNNQDYQHMTTTLSAMVTDNNGVSSVTIDLSSIGGSAVAAMSPAGGDVFSRTTNATGNPGMKSLVVNATDTGGNSNTSVSIQLKVARNGDVNGDDVVNIRDVVRLRNNITFPGNPAYALASTLAADVNGDGVIDRQDVNYLLNFIAYPGRYTLR